MFSITYSKDVRLPVQLQRAMAAEAEASREARAKVIAAEGELKASRALREASEVIGDSPAALQLRYLQVNLNYIKLCNVKSYNFSLVWSNRTLLFFFFQGSIYFKSERNIKLLLSTIFRLSTQYQPKRIRQSYSHCLLTS